MSRLRLRPQPLPPASGADPARMDAAFAASEDCLIPLAAAPSPAGAASAALEACAALACAAGGGGGGKVRLAPGGGRNLRCSATQSNLPRCLGLLPLSSSSHSLSGCSSGGADGGSGAAWQSKSRYVTSVLRPTYFSYLRAGGRGGWGVHEGAPQGAARPARAAALF